ncbi:MAG: arsenite transporter [Archaeoglobi archaeon]|nr:arsenite transporter [Archaeoglobi archaeon]
MSIQRFASFVRDKYSYIIITSLILGILVGFYTNYPGLVLKKFSVAFIVVMIASMGFTITFRSFALALRDLKGFSFGMALNFIFAPLLCYAIALAVPEPEIAVGLILIGAVPCAGMAMVWAGLLDGDVPLAVVINTGTMILAPFVIPLIMLYLAGSYVKINAVEMFLNLIYTILLPVLAGMVAREIAERKIDVKRYLPLCPAISALCAVFLMFIAVNTSMPIILKNLQLLPPLIVSAVIIFPSLFAFAYVVSSRLFNRAKNVAITYSCGMKNLPIALGIAIMSFGTLVALPIAVSFAFQMLTAVGFYRIFRRVEAAEAQGTGGV